jgi:hypothetical protein
MSEADPAWAKGFDMAELKERAAIFAAAFRPYIHGAFGLPKENSIAEALAAGECVWTKAGGQALRAVALAKRLKSASRQADFAGRVYKPQAGDIMVRAIAGDDEARGRILKHLGELKAPAIWVEDFVEAPHSALWAKLGFEQVATKVMASSDIKGLWLKGAMGSGRQPAEPLAEADRPALAVLQERWLSADDLAAIQSELAAYCETEAGAFAQHYSSYNKRGSWTAFALQGFDADDPAFIIKPAEMSKQWKADNPGRLSAVCGTTRAAQRFPATMGIVGRLPGRAQRVRFMRLAGGNGELSRHADITDPEAGTGPEQTARIHIPLQSPPGCHFIGWGLDGQRHQKRFEPGALCYLDTRKPHSAINPDEADRIHLVVDLFGNEEMRALIERAS